MQVCGEHSVDIEALRANAWLCNQQSGGELRKAQGSTDDRWECAINNIEKPSKAPDLTSRCLCILGAWEITAHHTLLTEAIHRAGPVSKELRVSPKHYNLFRTEERSEHRNEERQKGAQLQGERSHFERGVAANQVFWQKLYTTVELVISCVANIRCARMFHHISLLPPKG